MHLWQIVPRSHDARGCVARPAFMGHFGMATGRPKGHFLQHGWPAAMRGGSPPSFLDLERCDLRCKLGGQRPWPHPNELTIVILVPGSSSTSKITRASSLCACGMARPRMRMAPASGNFRPSEKTDRWNSGLSTSDRCRKRVWCFSASGKYALEPRTATSG